MFVIVIIIVMVSVVIVMSNAICLLRLLEIIDARFFQNESWIVKHEEDLGSDRRSTLGIIILGFSTSHDFISILIMNGYDEFLEK
jgi:hypothetical protein